MEEIPIEYQVTETKHDLEQFNVKHCDLYILIHGLHGNQQDFHFIAQKLKELYNNDSNNDSEQAIIIDCACNEGKTAEGIESLGMNVLCEVLKIIYERKVSLSNNQKLKLSVIGHSLGGLIGRYFIKLLYDLPNTEISHSFLNPEYSKYFVNHILPNLVPCSFTTISTPHLGSRRPGGGNYFGSAYRLAAHSFLTILGKTGKELILSDGNSIEECLLYRMSLPDSDYVKVLKKFLHRTLIASCHLDSTVPFPSASIRSFNPYPNNGYGEPSMKVGGISADFLESPEYVSLLGEFFTPGRVETNGLEERIDDLRKASWKGTELEPFEGISNDAHKNLFRDNYFEVEFEGKMLKNLQDIKWRRIDLDFTVSNFLQSREIHVVVVRKKMPIIGSSAMDYCGERCVNLVTKLCKYDSDHLLK